MNETLQKKLPTPELMLAIARVNALKSDVRGYSGEYARQTARLMRGRKKQKVGTSDTGKALLRAFLKADTEERLQEILDQSAHPEFLPRFFEAAQKEDNKKAKYWLHRALGGLG